MDEWKEILKIDIEKVWPFPKKPQQTTNEPSRTAEQQDKINVFSRGRGVSEEQAARWLYQNNWKMPQDLKIEYGRTPSGSKGKFSATV